MAGILGIFDDKSAKEYLQEIISKLRKKVKRNDFKIEYNKECIILYTADKEISENIKEVLKIEPLFSDTGEYLWYIMID